MLNWRPSPKTRFPPGASAGFHPHAHDGEYPKLSTPAIIPTRFNPCSQPRRKTRNSPNANISSGMRRPTVPTSWHRCVASTAPTSSPASTPLAHPPPHPTRQQPKQPKRHPQEKDSKAMPDAKAVTIPTKAQRAVSPQPAPTPAAPNANSALIQKQIKDNNIITHSPTTGHK